MTYMNKKELKNIEKSIISMMDDVDVDNPYNMIAFANTLIQIGNTVLNKTVSQLISRAYTHEELKKINPKLMVEEKMNPINRELQEIRTAIEHYERIIREDTLIGAGELEDDGRPKLSQEDIDKIKAKISGLTEKRDELLKQEKDYLEVN